MAVDRTNDPDQQEAGGHQEDNMSDNNNSPETDSPESIREAFGAGASPRIAAGLETPLTDASLHSAQRIRADVMNPETGAGIREGLEIPRAAAAPADEIELTPRDQAALAEAKRELAAEEQRSLQGEAALYLLHEQALETANFEANDELTAAILGNAMSQLAPEAVETLLQTAAYAAVTGYAPETDLDEALAEFDDEDAIEFGDEVERLRGLGQAYAALDRQQELAAIEPGLRAAAEQEREATVSQIHQEFAANRGLSQAEAAARLERVRETFYEDTGRDLNYEYLNSADFDPAAYRDVLTLQDGGDRGAQKAQAERAFQQAVMDGNTTDISAGLTQRNPVTGKHEPMQDTTLPPVRQERVNALAAKEMQGPERAADVKRGLIEAPSTSVADGLTSGGKRVTIPEATGELEKARRRNEEEIARFQSKVGGRKIRG